MKNKHIHSHPATSPKYCISLLKACSKIFVNIQCLFYQSSENFHVLLSLKHISLSSHLPKSFKISRFSNSKLFLTRELTVKGCAERFRGTTCCAKVLECRSVSVNKILRQGKIRNVYQLPAIFPKYDKSTIIGPNSFL